MKRPWLKGLGILSISFSLLGCGLVSHLPDDPSSNETVEDTPVIEPTAVASPLTVAASVVSLTTKDFGVVPTVTVQMSPACHSLPLGPLLSRATYWNHTAAGAPFNSAVPLTSGPTTSDAVTLKASYSDADTARLSVAVKFPYQRRK